jgi:glutaredoxin-like protein NrdH
MDTVHVEGVNKGHVVLYALSTCAWCKKTKKLLNDMGVEYYYIDMDLLQGKEREKVLDEVQKWNPRCSFPTIVVNDDVCIVGYDESKIKEVLGK